MNVAMSASVLVLNRSYMAIHVVDARRAFSLLFKEDAEVVTVEEERYATYDWDSWKEVAEARDNFPEQDYDWIHTVSFRIPVPKVIRLFGYDRVPSRQVKFNRRNIYARDENTCQYCGKRTSTTELTIDHVVPRSKGGPTTWANVVVACTPCNSRKGGRLLHQTGMRLIRQAAAPRRSPVIALKIRSPRYRTWQHFLNEAYWEVELT